MLAALEKAQHKLEAVDGWSVEQKVEAVISRLSLDGETPCFISSRFSKRT